MKKVLVSLFALMSCWYLLAQDQVIVTGTERIDNWKYHQQMAEESIFKNLPWIQIGPLINSGRIAGIVGIPGDPSIVYASATVGGVWKTVNAGTSWKPIFENQPSQTIGDIEVCSSNPDLLWVGTGSSNLSGSAYPGMGVFKTTDGGETWKHMGLEECQHVMRIAISPANPDHVYVAAMGHKYCPEEGTIGLYKTIDGGVSWRKILSDESQTGCADVVINPENPEIVFATTWNRKKTEGNVYRSTDGGEHWMKLTNGLPRGEKIGRIGINISLSNPKVVYAFMNNHNDFDTAYPEYANKRKKEEYKGLSLDKVRRMNSKRFLKLDSLDIAKFLREFGIIRSFGVNEIRQMIKSGDHKPESLVDCIEKYWISDNNRSEIIAGEVYRSDDGGDSWYKTHTEPLYLLSSFGWSFCDIVVSPDNEDDIYLLGVTLQHSEDGGKNFKPNEGRQVHLQPNISEFLHLDQHDLWIDPKDPDRILLGNDGGAFISYDRGSVWMHHNTIPIGMFYKIAADMEEPYNIYGGTQDDSHVYGPSDQNLAYNVLDKWKYVWLDRWSGGDGLHIMSDVEDPNTVYYSSQAGALRRKDLAENSNTYVRPKREFCEPALRHDWSTPFYVSPYEKHTIYYGANRLYKSVDQGDTWQALSPDLTKQVAEGKKQSDKLTSIAIDKSDPGLIYTGSNAGELYITRDGGKVWTNISKGLPGIRVNSIQISNHKKGCVYIAMAGINADRNPYLFKSSDFGFTWSSINANLPLEKTRCIIEDEKREDCLFAGTEKGVYVSLDEGGSWYSLSKGLPAVSVDDLLIHPRESELVIGTYGRGIYKMDISYIREFSKEIEETDFYLFDVKNAYLPQRRDYDGDWFFETADYPDFVFYVSSPRELEIIISDNMDKKVKEFKIEAGTGLNYLVWDMVKKSAEYSNSAYKGGTELYKSGRYSVSIKESDSDRILTKDFEISEQ